MHKRTMIGCLVFSFQLQGSRPCLGIKIVDLHNSV
jgi:hypothetical protein